MKIFISHSHKDKEFVRRLADDLSKEGFDVWLDEDLISPGEQWTDKINEAIENSDVVLIIISSNTSESRFQASEIAFAISSQRKHPSKRIVPVLTEKNAELPFFLRNVVYCDLSSKDKYESNFKSLVRALSEPSGPAKDLRGSDLRRIETIKAEKQMLQHEKNIFYKNKVIWTSTVLGMLASVIAALVTFFIGFAASNASLGNFISYVIKKNSFLSGVVLGATCSIVAFIAAKKYQNRFVRGKTFGVRSCLLTFP